MKVLVTGGAGFIGSFLVDQLVQQGDDVRILDNLDPQVHQDSLPEYLNEKAEFVRGDMRNIEDIKGAIKDVDIIIHHAAMVGVGQSMYQIKKYVEVNSLGTANLLDLLVNQEHNVKKLVVASSMSTYGEGSYKCESCGVVSPLIRTEEQMRKSDWELHCPDCGAYLKPAQTKESKKQDINSVYALTKKDQEDMCLNVGKTYGIPTTALRYFNVYGPRQSLSNPYTGVIAIFMSRIKNNNQPLVFEDGNQTRDFISVHDIVDATLLVMKSKSADYDVFNIGTGRPTSIKRVAEVVARLCGKEIMPNITKKFRKGDIRHCIADVSKIKSKLGFEPKTEFEEGVKEIIEWSSNVEAKDMVDKATNELKEKGLID
ncbi:nucleoside-diphosphate-sugar epimerase [Candidatus Woesearchaeota archaeon]|nr:nucleoside-diphosphate-sugar epimerase [Candidatus Woesearchaeota archaeon]|tara:strand:+ start:13667 stop:14779 length:1113 start_codon:yes stop_codon:yes gene_type:complete